MSIQVILRTDVDGLGLRGDIVDVADGHFRNFLAPKGKAIVASPGALEQASRMRAARDARDHEAREAATTIASTLVPKVIRIEAKASGEGKLFGSVTAADVVEAVQAQTGVELERRQLEVEGIKTTGQHSVTASLHQAVSFPITLEVVAAE